MNRAEIIKALEGIPPEVSARREEVIQGVQGLPPEYQRAAFINVLAEPIAKVLSAQPEFGESRGFMIHQPTGSFGFGASEAAFVMTDRIVKRESPAGALSWLDKVLQTKRAAGRTIMALVGIAAEQTTELGNGIEMVPLLQLRQSAQRDSLLAPQHLSGHHYGPWKVLMPSKVALIVQGVVEPFITEQRESYGNADPHGYYNLLEDARLALSLVGPCAPIQAGSWFEYDDADLQAASFYSGITTTIHEIGPSWFAPDVVSNPAYAREAVSRFLGLHGTTQARVRVSLQRLNQGIRRLSAGDKAMEFSIALEALLAEGVTENTYKVGLRAALIVGGDRQKRAETRGTVSAVYALRSAVVHNGVAPKTVKVKGRGQVDSGVLATGAASITATVIRQVIAAGKLPDWYDLELGAEEEG